MVEDSEEEIEFEIESWERIRKKDFALLTAGKEKRHLLQMLGYEMLPSGELLNIKTKEKVKVTGKNETINLKKFPQTAIISGSHNFVRNIADYSELLAEKGDLKFSHI